jgi:hypothetical protein
MEVLQHKNEEICALVFYVFTQALCVTFMFVCVFHTLVYAICVERGLCYMCLCVSSSYALPVRVCLHMQFSFFMHALFLLVCMRVGFVFVYVCVM